MELTNTNLKEKKLFLCKLITIFYSFDYIIRQPFLLEKLRKNVGIYFECNHINSS